MVGQFDRDPEPGAIIGELFGETTDHQYPGFHVNSIWIDQPDAPTPISQAPEATMQLLAALHRYRQILRAANVVSKIFDLPNPSVALKDHTNTDDPFLYFQQTAVKEQNADYSIVVFFGDEFGFEVALQFLAFEPGSWTVRWKERFSWINPASIGNSLIAAAIWTSLLALGGCNTKAEIQSPHEPEQFYNCVITDFVAADNNITKHIALSANALIDNDANSEAEETALKKDRQRCLAALGLYKGPIDGVRGKDTRAAEKAFTEKYGVPVDWKSKAFTEVLIRRANDAWQITIRDEIQKGTQ